MILVKEEHEISPNYEDSCDWVEVNAEPNCPTFVAAVQRFAGDIEAMKELCSYENLLINAFAVKR